MVVTAFEKNNTSRHCIRIFIRINAYITKLMLHLKKKENKKWYAKEEMSTFIEIMRIYTIQNG